MLSIEKVDPGRVIVIVTPPLVCETVVAAPSASDSRSQSSAYAFVAKPAANPTTAR
jgi:hypothetical protein